MRKTIRLPVILEETSIELSHGTDNVATKASGPSRVDAKEIASLFKTWTKYETEQSGEHAASGATTFETVVRWGGVLARLGTTVKCAVVDYVAGIA